MKIILPILGWNIINYFYRVYILKNLKITTLNFISLYNLYFNNSLYPIIYSLRIFLFGYMIIPLIAYVDKSNKMKIYFYCFLVLFINQSFIPYLIKCFLPNKIVWPYNYNTGYIIYIFIGYIIHNYRINYIFKILIYLFGVLGLLLRLIISHLLTMKNRMPDRTEINYVNLPIVIYSCSVFLFIKEYSTFFFKIINSNFINRVGALSMGPFFLHYMIIWSLPHLIDYNKYSFTYRFFGAFIISFVCYIITFLIKKIPIIKYLTP